MEEEKPLKSRNSKFIVAIIIFIIFIVGHYVEDLMHCKIIYYLRNSRLIKYGVGLLIVYTTMLTFDEGKSPNRAFVDALIVFAIFIIFSKTNIYFTLVAMLILITIYIIETYINYYDKIDEHDKAKKLNKVNKILYIPLGIIIGIGFIFYFFQKKLEYKNKFSYYDFIFGIKKCHNT